MFRTMVASRVLVALPVILLLWLAVACQSAAPEATEQVVATEAPAPAAAAAPATAVPAAPQPPPAQVEPSPTAPAFRAAATVAPTARPAPAAEQMGDIKVDTLVIAVDPSAGETNLPWAGTVDHHQQMDLVMEVLVDIDAEQNVWVPQLATSWELSEDGTQWTFQLVEGVQFHDGWGEFTAHDVLHSARMMAHEDSILAYANDWRTIDLEASQVISDHELVVQLMNPNPDFLFYIAPSGGGVIMSKAFWDAEGLDGYQEDMIGTGPYRYTSRELGVNVTYEKLPDRHWRLNGEGNNPPEVDWPMVDLRWISEPATRNAGLLGGEVHLTELTRELADVAVTNHGMKVIQSNFPGNQLWGVFEGTYSFTENHSAPSDWSMEWMYPDLPATDMRIREAANRAIDKDLLIDTLFSGRVTISPVGGFYPNLPGWDPSWLERYDELYGYDPERARELIAEAGYSEDDGPDQKLIVMNIFGFPESPDLMQAIGVMMSDVGFDISYEEWQFNTFVAERRTKKENTLGMWVVPPSYKTVYAQLSLFNRSGSAGHFYETEELDELFFRLSSSADLAERAEIQNAMGDILFEEYAYIPLFYIFIEFVADPNVIDTWEFPGSDGANYGHFDLIRACRSAEPCY